MGSNQRGGIIRKNDNGTLERIDGTNTYIGSATLENGRVITKRFRCKGFDEDDVARRWEKWQCRKDVPDDEGAEDYYKEEDMANEKKNPTCPLSGNDCTATCPMFSIENMACSIMLGGIALYNMSVNIMKLDASESVEMVAMAVGELGSAMKSGSVGATGAAVTSIKAEPKLPTEADGVDAFFEGKTFLNFVNLHGKAVNGQYARFCKEAGFPAVKEGVLLEKVVERFPELKRVGVRGGSVFEAA